ncbi:MAG: hypothetical protein P4M02_12350 [Clostridia bacterium]|nr:hypothetical protein [Clostridia bacterium]
MTIKGIIYGCEAAKVGYNKESGPKRQVSVNKASKGSKKVLTDGDEFDKIVKRLREPGKKTEKISQKG